MYPSRANLFTANFQSVQVCSSAGASRVTCTTMRFPSPEQDVRFDNVIKTLFPVTITHWHVREVDEHLCQRLHVLQSCCQNFHERRKLTALILCFLEREKRFCDFGSTNSGAILLKLSRVLIFHSDSNLGHRTTFCLIAKLTLSSFVISAIPTKLYLHTGFVKHFAMFALAASGWKFPKFGLPDILLGFR